MSIRWLQGRLTDSRLTIVQGGHGDATFGAVEETLAQLGPEAVGHRKVVADKEVRTPRAGRTHAVLRASALRCHERSPRNRVRFASRRS